MAVTFHSDGRIDGFSGLSMPAGSIIQTVIASAPQGGSSLNLSGSISSPTFLHSDAKVTITPQRSNSKILLTWSCQIRLNPSSFGHVGVWYSPNSNMSSPVLLDKAHGSSLNETFRNNDGAGDAHIFMQDTGVTWDSTVTNTNTRYYSVGGYKSNNEAIYYGDQGVGITENIVNELLSCGIDVITTGNHVWDQKEIMEFIDKEERLLRPKNLFEPAPGKGFQIYKTKNDIKIGVLNLMGNVFMKKCEDVFEASQKFLKENEMKKDFDLLVVDFHGEITSEKNAIGHLFDGKATLVVGTHTHIPTNDARILNNGTGYQTDAGMCGDYDSVIGMNKENSLNRFLKKNSVKHFPATGDATLCGVIVDCDIKTGLAIDIKSYVYGDQLKNI